ncbi:homoserine dehydrogenase [Paenibacillus humicola]|uniref:homoserine dehydrogenase n=1 Tax=Paenibacillus humicola TaxID=3110540 RepID=UPI00237A6268|nr:homoserine dehydrogenase [Paenibacillus humicola]
MGEQQRISIALLGMGTVGTGIIKSLLMNADKQIAAFGAEIELAGVLVRDPGKPRGVEVGSGLLTDRYETIAEQDGVSVVIEAIGGIEPAQSFIIDSLRRGRHVITANKALMALHGGELTAFAERCGARLLYEASVGGAIPAIGALSQFLRFNEIRSIAGILNGTTNYILTRMMQSGIGYGAALEEAQRLGFAEADPTSDVEGFDAMYKLMILARIAWGADLGPDEIDRRGITGITAADIAMARETGRTWKLVAWAERDEDGRLRASVRPELLEASHPLAGVHNEYNAVTIAGNLAGELTFSGRGAGELPTASAILGDLSFLLTGGQGGLHRLGPADALLVGDRDL